MRRRRSSATRSSTARSAPPAIPVIVVDVLKREMHLWKDRIAELIRTMPTATEHEIGWRLVDEMTVKGAALLTPVFEAQRGTERPALGADRSALLPRPRRDPPPGRSLRRARAQHHRQDPGHRGRHPGDRRGHVSRHQHQRHGLLLAAAVRRGRGGGERGLHRREQEGQDIETMGPVCTIMVGRLDDWLKVVADKQEISVDPGVLEWAGVAVFKKTYRLFQERGYRIRLLSAAFRNHMHWSELIGGDVVISPPHAWQKRFNKSGIAVDAAHRHARSRRSSAALETFDDYRRASTENGLSREEFDTFPPTRRTLRQFIAACHDLDAQVRDLMLPNPDGA